MTGQICRIVQREGQKKKGGAKVLVKSLGQVTSTGWGKNVGRGESVGHGKCVVRAEVQDGVKV